MAVSGPWQSGSGMYVDWGSGWVAVALCSWGPWLGHCGTSVDGSSGSGTFVYGGSDRKAVTCVLVGPTTSQLGMTVVSF